MRAGRSTRTSPRNNSGRRIERRLRRSASTAWQRVTHCHRTQRRPRETALPINLTFSRSARAVAGWAIAAALFATAVAAAPKPDIGHFTLGQRPRSGRGAGPPRAGRHPHGLVQGRRRRRDAGQVGPRPFPRTSDVQGHRQASDGRVLANGRLRRRPGKRLHHPGLHRLLPARVARASQDADGIRVRPHDRPGADRCGGGARTQGRPRGAEPARRQQSRARGSPSRSMPRSTSIIPTAGR